MVEYSRRYINRNLVLTSVQKVPEVPRVVLYDSICSECGHFTSSATLRGSTLPSAICNQVSDSQIKVATLSYICLVRVQSSFSTTRYFLNQIFSVIITLVVGIISKFSSDLHLEKQVEMSFYSYDAINYILIL